MVNRRRCQHARTPRVLSALKFLAPECPRSKLDCVHWPLGLGNRTEGIVWTPAEIRGSTTAVARNYTQYDRSARSWATNPNAISRPYSDSTCYSDWTAFGSNCKIGTGCTDRPFGLDGQLCSSARLPATHRSTPTHCPPLSDNPALCPLSQGMPPPHAPRLGRSPASPADLDGGGQAPEIIGPVPRSAGHFVDKPPAQMVGRPGRWGHGMNADVAETTSTGEMASASLISLRQVERGYRLRGPRHRRHRSVTRFGFRPCK